MRAVCTYAVVMAKSTVLALGVRRTLEQILADPDGDWTTYRLRHLPTGSARAAEKAMEVLLESGAATAEPTGRTLPEHDFERNSPRILEYRYRLTEDGPSAIEQILEVSRSYRGVIAMFFLEGGTVAGQELRLLRARNQGAPRIQKRRRHGRKEATPSSATKMYDSNRLRLLRLGDRLRKRQ